MLKKILTVVIILVIAVLSYAASKADTFYVERSIDIKATPEKVFAIINDHHNWDAWSPWEKLDPTMKKTFSGNARGVGAIFEWDGNSQVGAGRSEITESVSPSKIAMKLDMSRPFAANNNVTFNLQPHGETTTVAWGMNGSRPFLGKVISVFFDCEKMVGAQFDEGLVSLKGVAEKVQ